jgi:vesicle coat complex subunit
MVTKKFVANTYDSVALLSSGPEVQYVALRNILLIVQRRPTVLKNDVKVFFCKYNDPIYVKLAKLEIMYRLARAENAREVLAELQEYVKCDIGCPGSHLAFSGTPQKWT